MYFITFAKVSQLALFFLDKVESVRYNFYKVT